MLSSCSPLSLTVLICTPEMTALPPGSWEGLDGIYEVGVKGAAAAGGSALAKQEEGPGFHHLEDKKYNN